MINRSLEERDMCLLSTKTEPIVCDGGCGLSACPQSSTAVGRLDLAHIGRSWRGHALEDDCPCGKAPCGLVDSQKIDPDCQQHALGAARTIRQGHFAEDCPHVR